MARSVQDRIQWYRDHDPGTVGMCLRHIWLATLLPSVGMPDANAGAAYVTRHDRMHEDRNPPRGAWVWWTSDNHGHVALSLGDKRVLSTDVDGPATTGIRPLSFFEREWNQHYEGWSAWYGQPFPIRRSRLVQRISEKINNLVSKLRHLRRRRKKAN